MRMPNRKLRCFAERSDGLWVTYCLEFGLAAQGDTFDEAKDKLEAQIRDISREEAEMLIGRGSPASLWVRYAYIWAVIHVAHAFGRDTRRRKRFTEAVPPNLVPC